mgnify:CR=1 FL=1
METLLAKSSRAVKNVAEQKKRYLYGRILWNKRLVGIKGARGTGKSTMLLQKLQELKLPDNEASYWSLDDLYFLEHSLAATAEHFTMPEGECYFWMRYTNIRTGRVI